MANRLGVVKLTSFATAFTVPADAQGVTVHIVWWGNAGGPTTMSALTSNFTDTFTWGQTATQGGPVYPSGNIAAWARVTSTGSGKTITPTFGWGVDEGPVVFVVFWDGIPETGDWVRPTGNGGTDPRTWTIVSGSGDAVNGTIPTNTGDQVIALDANATAAAAVPTGWTSVDTQSNNGFHGQLRVVNTAGASSTSTSSQTQNYASLGMIAVMDGGGGGGGQTLLPSLVTNTQSFFSPTVSLIPTGTVLQPSLVTNAQTFFNSTISRMPDGARGQWIVDNTGPVDGNPAGILYNDVDLPGDATKWFSFVITTPPATGDLDILPDGRFTFTGPNPETMYYQLYVDNVAVGVPQLVELYTQGEVQELLPPRVTNTQTFFNASVLRGTVTLSPPRVNNAQTFYSPVVSADGVIPVVPSLVVNSQTFFGPTVRATGTVVMTPPRITNTQIFFTARVTNGDLPPPSEGATSQKIGLRVGIGL